MSTSTIRGTYGSDKNMAYVYTYEKDGGTWYAVDGSKVANFTHEELEEGVNVEEVADADTLTWNRPIESEEDLCEAVDDEGEEEDPLHDTEAEDDLTQEGRARLDEIAERHKGGTDAPAQRQELNDAVDAYMRDEVEHALMREYITEEAKERIEKNLSGYAADLHQ